LGHKLKKEKRNVCAKKKQYKLEPKMRKKEENSKPNINQICTLRKG